MVEIYRSIKANINKYIDMVKAQITKEEFAIKKDEKNEKKFVLNLCVLINTIDYIKETVNKMNDVIFNLIDEPYNQNLDFSEEEDKCAKVCIEIINALIKLFESKLDSIFGDQMLKLQWDKVENVTSVSGYVHSVNKVLRFFSENIKDNINNVYLIRCFKMLSEVTNNKFLEYIYRIRKINQQSVQLLHIEIKQQLYNIGLNTNGEPISNIYNSVLEQHSEKTRNVIKILGMNNDQVASAIKETLSNMAPNELNKMLTLKGLKKSEINQIIEKS